MPNINMSAFWRSAVCPFNTSEGMYLCICHTQRRKGVLGVQAQANGLTQTGGQHAWQQTLYFYSPPITLFNIALPVAAAGGGQTKITKLVGCFINYVNVVWLDIHVHHVPGVHMLQCQTNLQTQSHAWSVHARPAKGWGT